MADNGQQAVEYLANPDHSFQVVLMDVQMPVMDGFETLKHLRADPELSRNKVIALTALAMKGDMEKCMEAGADDYCTKPVDIDLLLKKPFRNWTEEEKNMYGRTFMGIERTTFLIDGVFGYVQYVPSA